MARARDLAGLAALGALAYHLRPGKDLKTETQTAGPQTAGVDPDAISPEDAAMGARGNAEMARMAALDNPDFEPGMYTKEPGGDSAPAPARAAPTRSAAAAPARAPARPAARPSAGMNNSAGGRGPGFGELEAYRQQQYEAAQRQAATPQARAARQAAIEGQAAENMTGDFIPMGRLAKAAGSAGTALAKFAGPKALGMSERKALEMSRAQEPARALANNPTRQISGPSKADLVARDRAARAAARERGMLEENAARYNLDPSDPAFAAQAAAVRSSLGGKDFTLRKKGGKVKTKKMASGGVSSASKRADGIATRGKTKYKIY